jgi:hypothetical protein
MESMFNDGEGIHFYRAENIDSGFNVKQFKYLLLSIRPSKSNPQNLEHQFSKRWLIYNKHGIFGVGGSCVYESNLKYSLDC